MYIYNWLKKLNKKGDIPGWAIVVGLIIGLFVIFAVWYISIKGKNFLMDAFQGLRNMF
jgi:amino acid transporter